jgi:hypothetical protein
MQFALYLSIYLSLIAIAAKRRFLFEPFQIASEVQKPIYIDPKISRDILRILRIDDQIFPVTDN